MDFYNILQRSWEIVKRQKVLWVFGMVLAVFAGGGGGGSFQSGGNLDGLEKFFQKREEISPETSEKISSVLGAITSDPGVFFSSIFSQVSPLFWIALLLGILLLVIFAIVFGTFMRNFAIGALFALVAEEEKGQELTLKKGSDFGRRFWLRLFLIPFILWGCLILAAIVGVFGSAIVTLVLPGWLKMIVLLPLALGALAAMIMVMVITVWIAFANLVVVLEDYPVKKTLSFSWKLTKKFFFEGVVLGIINTGIGCLVGCGTIAIIMLAIGFIVIGFLIHKSIGIFLLLCLGTLGLLLIFGGVLIQGIYRAFTSTNWVLLYLELKKKEDFPTE